MGVKRDEITSAGEPGWFEEVWRQRDEEIYPAMLGGSSENQIFRIPYAAFSQLGAERVDPRWLHCGVLRFGPTTERPGFAFIISGRSNPWDDAPPILVASQAWDSNYVWTTLLMRIGAKM